jgi:hypothetical protein
LAPQDAGRPILPASHSKQIIRRRRIFKYLIKDTFIFIYEKPDGRMIWRKAGLPAANAAERPATSHVYLR